MIRTALLLGLLCTLAGTPLRIVEASSDLARTLADPRDVDDIEATDGGVGDDSGETIATDRVAPLDLAPSPFPSPRPADRPVARVARRPSAAATSPHPVARSRGRALLQAFLC